MPIYMGMKSLIYWGKEEAEEADNIEEVEDISLMIDVRNGAQESYMSKWQRQWEVTEKGDICLNLDLELTQKKKITEQSKFPSIIRQLRIGYFKLNEYWRK